VYVFQTTKGGSFRGSNHFQHDVDIVIEIPEKGYATQNGRFNQGGEMQIFEANTMDESEELGGIKKKKKNSTHLKSVKKKERFPDWTEPEHLNRADWESLKIIKRYYDEGEYSEAMNYAMYDADTVVREEIPPNVWLDIGGTLTSTGREKLRALLEAYPDK
jgi:hypothetical protein